MKTDHASLSKRFCNVGCLGFLVCGFYPQAPDWIMGSATIAMISGLCFMLVKEITERKLNKQLAAIR